MLVLFGTYFAYQRNYVDFLHLSNFCFCSAKEIGHIFSCRRSRADLVISITVVVLVVVLEPLPLLSELSPFRTFRLSVDFSLGGTMSFVALYPLEPFALHYLLLFGSFILFGTFEFFSYCRQLGL